MEILKRQKVGPQDAKQIVILSFFISLLITVVSCSVKQGVIIETRHGSYKFTINKTGRTGDPIVTGLVSGYKGSQPVSISAIMVDNKKGLINKPDGTFKISVTPGKHIFKGKGLASQYVDTNPIKVNKGDSLHITFYLKDDETPLIDDKL